MLRRLVSRWATVGLLSASIANTAAGWTRPQTHANVSYFLFDVPARIERFNLSTQQWQPSIALSNTPTCFLIDDSGFYVGFGHRTSRIDEGTGAETHVANTSSDVKAILSWRDYLYLSFPEYANGNFLSVNKTNSTPVATAQFVYDAYIGPSLSSSQGKIFGWDEGVSPGDIHMLTLSTNGTFGPSVGSSYHGSYPGGRQTFMFPDGNRVCDDAGIIYNTADLTYNNSFAGTVDDIAFYKEAIPIVLRGRTVIAFSQANLETGRRGLTNSAAKAITVAGDTVFAFAPSSSGTGIAVEAFPVSALKAAEPSTALDPHGLPYTADAVFLDRDGVVTLYSKSLSSLFRWSSVAQAYTNTIPVTGTPKYVAYSPVMHRIYLAAVSGQIDQIALTAAPTQQPFANSPQEPLGLATAGEFVFVCDRAGPWVTHYTYAPDGARLSSKDWNYYSTEYIWCSANRKMYFFRDDTSPNDILSEVVDSSGHIGAQNESPYHGEVAAFHPIRVSPDGTLVLLGSGQVYDGATLVKTNNLANAVSDAGWIGSTLYTLREIGGLSQIQAWAAPNFAPAGVKQLSGLPIALLARTNGLLVISKYLGAPRFYLLDSSLNVSFSSPVPPAAPSKLVVGSVTGDSVSLGWQDESDNEDGFVVEHIELGTGQWKAVATTAANVTNVTVSGLRFATSYDFRVQSTNSVAGSDYAGPVAVRTRPDPRIPGGPPFELIALRVLATSVQLSWRDNATNEAGFVLERRIGNTPAWSSIYTSGPNITTYQDTNVVPATSYLYRIHAFNSFADSELSPELAVRTLSSDQLPPDGAPSDLRIVNVAASQVSITWADHSVNEDGFIIERANGGSSNFAEVGRVGPNETKFTDLRVSASTEYRYRVRAYNTFGQAFGDGLVLNVSTPSLGGAYLGMSARHGDLAYFVMDGPLRLERYDLKSQSWLPSLPLPDKPTAFLVADEGIYLSFGRKTSRFSFDMGTETFLVNRDSEVRILFVWGDYLYVSSDGTHFLSVQRSTGALSQDMSAGGYAWYPTVAVANTLAKVFARSSGVSPSDILSLGLRPDGQAGTPMESPYHGAYPSATAVYLFPDESRVLDGAGILYNTGDLTYAGSFGGNVDDVAFYGADVPIVLRGKSLLAFSNVLLETGRYELQQSSARILLSGTNIVAFAAAGDDLHGLKPEIVPLARVNPAQPGEPPKLYGLTFTPDDAFLDAGRVVHLFSRQYRALFRWSTDDRKSLDSIPLLGAPSFVAYSPVSHRYYFAYEPGQLTQIRPEESLREQPFANLPGKALGLATAGDLVFTCDDSGAWATHSLFAPDGHRIAAKDWNYISREYIWSQSNQKLYFFRDSVSPNDLLWEDLDANGIGTEKDSPYHGDFPIQHPIRVSPDGQVLVLGTGDVFNPITLERVNSLANPIVDATWRGQVLYTVREIGGLPQVQRWSTTFALTASAQFAGKPLRLWGLPAGLALLTIENDQPRVLLLSEDLQLLYQTPINLPPSDILVSMPGGFPENTPVGTVVARFSAVDPNADDTHTFELKSNPGGMFTITGDALILAKPADYETTPTVSILVRAVDPYGLAVEKQVTLPLSNVNEPPTGMRLSPSSVLENSPIGAEVGTLTVIDPDKGDTHALVLLNDAGGHFRLNGNRVLVAAPLSYATTDKYTIQVRATDKGGLSVEAAIVITVLPYVEPPPLGEVRVSFDPPGNLVSNTWVEAGLILSTGPQAFARIGAEQTNALPSGGVSYLRCSAPGQPLQIRHRTGLPFRIFSLDLAEISSQSGPLTVQLTGRQRSGRIVEDELVLDGVCDGPGPLQDFQTFYLPERMADLDELTLSAAGFALGPISAFVGAPPTTRPLVRLQPARVIAFENRAGVPEQPPFLHTAQIGVVRVGDLSQPLTCQLSLGGTAVYLVDYFVEGISALRTVTFQPGQASLWLEVFPIVHDSADGTRSILINLETATPYAIGQVRRAEVTIYDDAFSAWMAARWPGLDSGPLGILQKSADPDGNGLSNLAEFMLGADPRDIRTLVRPQFSLHNGAAQLVVTENKLAAGLGYVLEQATDLKTWTTVPTVPEVQADSPTTRTLSYSVKTDTATVFLRLVIREANP